MADVTVERLAELVALPHDEDGWPIGASLTPEEASLVQRWSDAQGNRLVPVDKDLDEALADWWSNVYDEVGGLIPGERVDVALLQSWTSLAVEALVVARNLRAAYESAPSATSRDAAVMLFSGMMIGLAARAEETISAARRDADLSVIEDVIDDS